MIEAMDFKITRIGESKLKDVNLQNIPFGHTFSDHMLEADFENGAWKTPQIRPYQPLMMAPSLSSLHYGQSIFEGIKAYRNSNNESFIFRPHENYKRFNISAERMEMPFVPEDIFIEGMRMLVDMDKSWIPGWDDHSLYIRPFMFSTDELLGVRPSDNYKFMIILSPTGPYYSTPMRIYVEEKYVRAVPGGVGYAKAAGNYGAAMYPTHEARKKGYDQVLWTDSIEHKYVQECGTMNVFFVFGDTAVTPDLESGTILAGVTRESTITILKDMGIKVEERPLSIDEVIESHRAGHLTEVFGTGTAATISLIKELRYQEYVMKFDVDSCKTAATVKSTLNDIRYGRIRDSHNWMFKV